MLKRLESKAKTTTEAVAPPAYWKNLPDLWEWLTVTVWPGTADERETGTLKLFWGEGGLAAVLNDRAQDLTGFVTLNDPQEHFLVTIDRKLREGTVDFRKAKPYSKKK